MTTVVLTAFYLEDSFDMQLVRPAYTGSTDFVRNGTEFSWLTHLLGSDNVRFYGTGFTFDGSNNPTAGTVTQFGISTFGDTTQDFSSFELQITGLSLRLSDLAPLTDGTLSTIEQQVNFVYRTVLGGSDTIDLGDRTDDDNYATLYGDGLDVEAGQSLHAGNDVITGISQGGGISGDYRDLDQGSSAVGGNDIITVSGSSDGGLIEGDANAVSGFLKGGDDILTEGSDGGISRIFGDADNVVLGGTVMAGNDVIVFTRINRDEPHLGVGDVRALSGALIAGSDKITGSNDEDILVGDSAVVTASAFAIGGNDTIHGRIGNDIIYGDWQTLATGALVTGGDDKLYGDDGNDTIYGNGGADYLDGGLGMDVMHGGRGNDTYVVDNIGDEIDEADGSGHDLVKSSVSFALAKGLEDLQLTGNAKIAGVGNSGDNIFIGNSAHNAFTGAGGRDTFVFNTKLVSSTYDTIWDFGHSTDTFELDNSVFKGMGSDSLNSSTETLASSAFKVISSATSTKGVDSNDRILFDKHHGDIYFDRDGSGTHYNRIKFAHVGSDLLIDHTDFLVI